MSSTSLAKYLSHLYQQQVGWLIRGGSPTSLMETKKARLCTGETDVAGLLQLDS